VVKVPFFVFWKQASLSLVFILVIPNRLHDKFELVVLWRKWYFREVVVIL